MDPRFTGEIFKHLEKQSEVLMESYRSLSHELHTLQVEEEMLMCKLYEVLSAHGLIKKNGDSGNVPDGDKNGDSTALVIATSNGQQ